MSVTGRSSSITNAFINAIIPTIEPTEAEELEALHILEMSPDDIRCAYCGDKATEWDHLRAIISNQEPTGYITEIANLVPACGKCTQSKGKSHWRTWMEGNAKLSPNAHGTERHPRKMKPAKMKFQWRLTSASSALSAAAETKSHLVARPPSPLAGGYQSARCARPSEGTPHEVFHSKTRGVPDLKDRIVRLAAYEVWRQPTRIDFAAVVGPEMWQRHRKNWRSVLDLLKTSQELASEIRIMVARAGSQ